MKTISLIKRTGNIGGHGFSLTLALIGLFLATFALRADVLAQVNPSWIPTGSLNTPRQHPTATLLPNGKVLVVESSLPNQPPPNTAELYDPSTGTWSFTGNLNTPRFLPTSTLLPNGKVLVVGAGASGASAELYDPTTGTWSITGSLNISRYSHTATLLQNGKVLVAGGTGGDNRAELYDPATGTWSVTGGLLTDRYGQTATLLQNGQVLMAGGWDDNDVIPTVLASAELYDPVTGTWSVTGNLNASRFLHTATLLPDGRVLIAAGYTYNWVPSHGGFAASPTSLNSAELYDPATGTWSVTASLNTRLSGHTATLLPNGKVLVAGGFYLTIDGNTPNDGTYPCGDTLSCSPKYLNAAELYDVATGTWSVTASLNTARSGHTATLLPNGKVLVAGGYNSNVGSLNSAELYNSHVSSMVDFDGDGISDIGVYRDGAWLVLRSSDDGLTAIGLGGLADDVPVAGDYDGDGKTDQAIYRNGLWFIRQSSNGVLIAVGLGAASGDVPVPADYDGDGKADQAIYRDGLWFIRQSSDGVLIAVGLGAASGDVPVPADYDGDGKADQAIYRNGLWFIRQSSDGVLITVGLGGLPDDIPLN